jgi:hypothetical protein
MSPRKRLFFNIKDYANNMYSWKLMEKDFVSLYSTN